MIALADIYKLISAIRASIDAFDVFAETFPMSDFEFTEVVNIWLELADTTKDGEKALSSFPHSLRNDVVEVITHHFSVHLQQIRLIIRAIQYHSYLGVRITAIDNGRSSAALAFS